MVQEHEKCSITLRRAMLALLGFALFALVTVLGAPDSTLITGDATIKVPFANADMPVPGFLSAAPLLLITIIAVLLKRGGGLPWFIVATDAFGWLSGIAALVLLRHRFLFLRQPQPAGLLELLVDRRPVARHDSDVRIGRQRQLDRFGYGNRLGGQGSGKNERGPQQCRLYVKAQFLVRHAHDTPPFPCTTQSNSTGNYRPWGLEHINSTI